MDAKPLFISGFGQFHTNEPDPKNPGKKLKPYHVIDLAGIRKLVDTPQRVQKDKAQWILPSTQPSRNFKTQEKSGKYWALWADLDNDPPTLPDLAVIIDEPLGGCDYEIYNSRSATVDNQKCRILIPLSKPLCFADWNLAQETLNDHLEALNITPDRAAERAAQLCYLPNKGEFYGSLFKREGKCFDPLQAWQSEIGRKRDALREAKERLETSQKEAMARREALRPSDTLDIYKTFNEAYTPMDWLVTAGYSQRGDSFCHPKSESGSYSCGVRTDDFGVLRAHALSPNDPIFIAGSKSGHDAFSVFATLNHGGNYAAALKDAGDNLLAIGVVSFNKFIQIEYAKQEARKQNESASSKAGIDYSTMPDDDEQPADKADSSSTSTFNQTLDTEQKYCAVDLLRDVDDGHLLKKLSQQISKATHLPVNTVFLMGMTVYSAMAARKFVVCYENSGYLPIGLYAAVEQPSGTGKSWCLSIFQKPFFDIHKQLCKNAQDDIKKYQSRIDEGEDLSDEDIANHTELKQKIKRLNVGLFISNATPEGVETTLAHTGGFFSAVSSEQGLFNSLLGGSYRADIAGNNNDVVLNGFDGGHISSLRVSRLGYVGNVVGGIACFAQQGSIETVLNASNGTGLAERFLMLAEPHSLGKRDHTKSVSYDDDLTSDYNKVCAFIQSIIENPKELNELSTLKINKSGFSMINKYRNKIEPHLADGGKFSHVSLRGAASKINMQIMKIAANLQLIASGDGCVSTIDDTYIKTAISIADELLEANLKLCIAKGIMGLKAEFTAILSLFEKDQRPRTERNIIQSKSQKIPFKDFSGNTSALIKQTLCDMVNQRLLIKTVDASGKSQYTLAQ